jgi:hypothetical protein
VSDYAATLAVHRKEARVDAIKLDVRAHSSMIGPLNFKGRIRGES